MKSSILGLAVAGIMGITPAIAADTLAIGTTGGDFAAALDEAFFQPFAKEKKIEVIVVPGSTAELTALLRAQTKSGQVEFDITTSNPQTVLTDPDIYEPLDCGRIPNAALNGVSGTCDKYHVMRTVGASVVAYATKAFPNGGPKTWADFFDTQKFPGKRCLMGGSVETYTPFLIALLADGVEPENLYPFDFDRALKKLRELRPHVSAYFTNYSMSQQLMRDGECVISPMLDGRATSLRNEGFAVTISLDKGIASTGYWSIAKGSKNKDLAYEFLDFWMSHPESHVKFFKRSNYATAHKDASKLLSEDEQKSYIGSEENFSKILILNSKWIAENDAEINRQYGKFLAGN